MEWHMALSQISHLSISVQIDFWSQLMTVMQDILLRASSSFFLWLIQTSKIDLKPYLCLLALVHTYQCMPSSSDPLYARRNKRSHLASCWACTESKRCPLMLLSALLSPHSYKKLHRQASDGREFSSSIICAEPVTARCAHYLQNWKIFTNKLSH